jgi:pyridinium-3,5-bisthiocarboxylic acid mononucleotide nickel chelatase
LNIAWFHCFAGIAGDMSLGSLIDAGADVSEVRAMLDRIPVSGWDLEVSAVQKSGLGATHVKVLAPDDGTAVRTYAHITGLIEEARLPERVRNRAQSVFAVLAEAEGQIHNAPISQVHFHEVGGIDAIVDIIGTCAALEVLGIDEVFASPVAQGTGMVRMEHGLFPNPVPAVVRLFSARGIPTYGRDINLELTTPTGAAILSALSVGFGPIPAMQVRSTGYGAGTRDLEGMPNVVQVVIGERSPATLTQPMVLLETNVDDVTGEVLAQAIQRLIEEGAADAWLTPIVMKKGRPAFTVSALSDPALVHQLTRVLSTETGSLGIRMRPTDRWAADRRMDEVDVEGMPLRVKVGAGRAKGEFDDAAKIARLSGLPVREILARGEAAWRRAQESRHTHPSKLDR